MQHRMDLNMLVESPTTAAAVAKVLATLDGTGLVLTSISVYPDFDAHGDVSQPATAAPEPATGDEPEQPERPEQKPRTRIMKKAEAKLVAAGVLLDRAVEQGLVGTGKDGMITQADVDGFLKGRETTPAKAAEPPPPKPKGAPEFADVRKALGAFVQANGKDAARAWLNTHFDVDRISALPESRYQECIDKLAAG